MTGVVSRMTDLPQTCLPEWGVAELPTRLVEPDWHPGLWSVLSRVGDVGLLSQAAANLERPDRMGVKQLHENV
jgi:hypothetical protein